MYIENCFKIKFSMVYWKQMFDLLFSIIGENIIGQKKKKKKERKVQDALPWMTGNGGGTREAVVDQRGCEAVSTTRHEDGLQTSTLTLVTTSQISSFKA